ncbi:MAG TPA: serine/threonine-protein phosphatase, partial [Hyphomicrobiales bacterium]|nr:serine/threonine-protein phosphatase [Hyphomicrobiales bacterium]
MRDSALVFETGAATHVGRVREANEDGLLADADLGVWLVADGLGGHEKGELASATIVEEVSGIGEAASAADQIARFRNAVLRANAKLLRAARQL